MKRKYVESFFLNIETYKFIQLYYVLMVQGNLEKKWKGNNNITLQFFERTFFISWNRCKSPVMVRGVRNTVK